ncbi:hypothetical protein GWI33_004342 [Rhynchophorus ferrugineus]|uniref:Ig-like domain-containing protein n=1 Tax=Rhynchophorus ferrugineus TaxID=354439 RepID=A0A834IZ85_RHYFE|nr:hypothetical protein GWI33_004342 [Rhynchophorus ferrugineus]
MISKIFAPIVFLLPTILSAPLTEHIDGVVLRTAQWGTNVVLTCLSNDAAHVFQYWHIVNKGVVIGPGNAYDEAKYRYHVLSGNLTIKAVTKHEEGIYECVSKKINNEGIDNINIKVVRIVVQNSWDKVYEDDSHINLIRVLVALITLVIIAMVVWFVYGIWKDRYRYPRYLEPDEEDDESTEEIFSRPGTSRQNIVPLKNKKPEETPFDDIDISTDFKSILDNTNAK